MQQGNDRRDIPIGLISRPYLIASYTPNSPRTNGLINSVLANAVSTIDTNLNIGVGSDIAFTVAQAGLYTCSAEARWNVAAGDQAELGIGWTKNGVDMAHILAYTRRWQNGPGGSQHCLMIFFSEEYFAAGDVVTFVTLSRTSVSWITSGENSYVNIRMVV